MNRVADVPRPAFTPLQGQYLAFIHAYTLVNGRPPAEHEMMRFFQVTPPTVHRMSVALEQAGLTWVRGHETHALDLRPKSVAYRRRTPGVCL